MYPDRAIEIPQCLDIPEGQARKKLSNDVVISFIKRTQERNVQAESRASKPSELDSSKPPIKMEKLSFFPPTIARENTDGTMTFYHHRKIKEEFCRTTIGDVELTLYTAMKVDDPPYYAMAVLPTKTKIWLESDPSGKKFHIPEAIASQVNHLVSKSLVALKKIIAELELP